MKTWKCDQAFEVVERYGMKGAGAEGIERARRRVD
jgi:hypothetical protein